MDGNAGQPSLPFLLGAVRQQCGDGELVLEQSDGQRSFRFARGELAALRSDAAGEQLGGWLLRQGILDRATLDQLLAHEGGSRIGERLVQRGLLGPVDRDLNLQTLQEQIMLHALEHPILRWTWNPGRAHPRHGPDPEFKLQDRHLIWRSLQACARLEDFARLLASASQWRWEGRLDLLDTICDMPLTPGTAFAVSFFSAEPIGFETFLFLSRLDRLEASRLIATLWAFGALVMTGGNLPTLAAPPPRTKAVPPPPPLPFIHPPPDPPFGPPKRAASKVAEAPIPFEVQDAPEFLDQDPPEEGEWVPRMNPRLAAALDTPPCGPRPQAPPEQIPLPADLPPCGPAPPPAPEPAAGAGRSWPGVSLAMPHPAPFQPTGPASPAPPPHWPGTNEPLRFLQSSSIELDPERRGLPGPPTAESRIDQTKANHLLAKARRQARLGHTVEAVLTLEQAVALQPEGDGAYEGWLMLGRLRMLNPAWLPRAILAFQNASRIRPREAEPMLCLGEAYHKEGSETQASEWVARARHLAPPAEPPLGKLPPWKLR